MAKSYANSDTISIENISENDFEDILIKIAQLGVTFISSYTSFNKFGIKRQSDYSEENHRVFSFEIESNNPSNAMDFDFEIRHFISKILDTLEFRASDDLITDFLESPVDYPEFSKETGFPNLLTREKFSYKYQTGPNSMTSWG